jgi:hypothetical protein
MRKILIVVVLGALTVAACGGSSSSSNAKSGSNPTQSGGSSSFDQLYNQRKNASLKVTYQTMDSSGTAGDTFTIAQDGATKTAYINADEETIVNGDTVTTCSNLKDKPECTTQPGGAAAAQATVAAFTGLLTAAETGINAWAAAGGKGDQSTETIAGRTADCVTITGSSLLGSVGGAIASALGANKDAGYESCIDKDTGVLLKWVLVGVKGDQSGVTASEVTTPSDADFQPPAGATTQTTPTTGSSGSGSAGRGSGTTTCMTIPGGVTLPAGITIPGACSP